MEVQRHPSSIMPCRARSSSEVAVNVGLARPPQEVILERYRKMIRFKHFIVSLGLLDVTSGEMVDLTDRDVVNRLIARAEEVQREAYGGGPVIIDVISDARGQPPSGAPESARRSSSRPLACSVRPSVVGAGHGLDSMALAGSQSELSEKVERRVPSEPRRPRPSSRSGRSVRSSVVAADVGSEKVGESAASQSELSMAEQRESRSLSRPSAHSVRASGAPVSWPAASTSEIDVEDMSVEIVPVRSRPKSPRRPPLGVPAARRGRSSPRSAGGSRLAGQDPSGLMPSPSSTERLARPGPARLSPRHWPASASPAPAGSARSPQEGSRHRGGPEAAAAPRGTGARGTRPQGRAG